MIRFAFLPCSRSACCLRTTSPSGACVSWARSRSVGSKQIPSAEITAARSQALFPIIVISVRLAGGRIVRIESLLCRFWDFERAQDTFANRLSVSRKLLWDRAADLNNFSGNHVGSEVGNYRS